MILDYYSFVFRGLLAESALDQTERMSKIGLTANIDHDIARRLPIDQLDEELVARAKRMATVYIAIAAFENSVRAFVAQRLLEEVGADWWNVAVSESIRNKAQTRRDQEEKIRWHTMRGGSPIEYTEFGDLASIVGQNWKHFEDHVHSQDWVRHLISSLERSRNVIMHSGDLGMHDIERIGTTIRDWIRQVGA